MPSASPESLGIGGYSQAPAGFLWDLGLEKYKVASFYLQSACLPSNILLSPRQLVNFTQCTSG